MSAEVVVAVFDPNGRTDMLSQMKDVVLADGIRAHLPLAASIPRLKSSPRS
jgi:hypothetical protein